MTTELSKVEARQGETLNQMRYVLAGHSRSPSSR
jgi:hypothetical protein